MSFRHIDVLPTTDGSLHRFHWKPTHPTPIHETPRPIEEFQDCLCWEGWDVDRLLVLDEDNSYSRFLPFAAATLHEPDSVVMKELLAQLYMDTDFDGEVAFIPAAHANAFWDFLREYVEASLTHQETFDFQGNDVEVQPDIVCVSGSPTWFVGHSTKEGLWIVYGGSCDDISNAPMETILRQYPEDLKTVHVDCMRESKKPVLTFDPTRAWRHGDCHLFSNLTPDRHDDNETFQAFLKGASETGGLYGIIDDPAPQVGKQHTP